MRMENTLTKCRYDLLTERDRALQKGVRAKSMPLRVIQPAVNLFLDGKTQTNKIFFLFKPRDLLWYVHSFNIVNSTSHRDLTDCLDN